MDSLKEFKSLAEAAGYSVAATVEQVRKMDSRFQIGRGRISEIVELVKNHNAEKLIFDNVLKPRQAYNLAKATGVEAIDRFQLILEIFTRRASTREAKLQTQLARLHYELAHAKEKVRLARMEEQPGFMGLGSYEVNVYHLAVQRQIHTIQKKLKRIRKKRGLHRKRRQELGFSSISLTGYTCAGKSTLFNLLAREAVPTGEELFVTLSTTTRIADLLGRRVLITDAVGFIDRLPITVIDAFRSTLEETVFSDLILLVADASESLREIKRKLSVSLRTIKEIGAHGIPMVTALNKIDLLSKLEIQQRMNALEALSANIVPISALRNVNVDLLKQQITKNLEGYIQATFSIPLSREAVAFLSRLYDSVHIKDVEYGESSAKVVMEALPEFAERIAGQVKRYGGTFERSDHEENEDHNM